MAMREPAAGGERGGERGGGERGGGGGGGSGRGGTWDALAQALEPIAKTSGVEIKRARELALQPLYCTVSRSRIS